MKQSKHLILITLSLFLLMSCDNQDKKTQIDNNSTPITLEEPKHEVAPIVEEISEKEDTPGRGAETWALARNPNPAIFLGLELSFVPQSREQRVCWCAEGKEGKPNSIDSRKLEHPNHDQGRSPPQRPAEGAERAQVPRASLLLGTLRAAGQLAVGILDFGFWISSHPSTI